MDASFVLRDLQHCRVRALGRQSALELQRQAPSAVRPTAPLAEKLSGRGAERHKRRRSVGARRTMPGPRIRVPARLRTPPNSRERTTYTGASRRSKTETQRRSPSIFPVPWTPDSSARRNIPPELRHSRNALSNGFKSPRPSRPLSQRASSSTSTQWARGLARSTSTKLSSHSDGQRVQLWRADRQLTSTGRSVLPAELFVTQEVSQPIRRSRVRWLQGVRRRQGVEAIPSLGELAEKGQR